MKTLIILLFTLLASSNINAEIFTRQILIDSANQQNTELPMRVDGYSWLQSVMVLEGRKIQFSYKVETDIFIQHVAKQMNISVSNLKSQAKIKSGGINGLVKDLINTALKPLIIKGNCTTPGTKDMIQDGVHMLHTYYGSDGAFLTEVSITKNVCEKSA